MPLRVQQEIEGGWTFGLGDMALSPTMIDGLESARRFLWREPERSRRVLRLLCAHYLAHLETREFAAAENRPSGPRFSYLTSTNPVTKGKISVPLYPVSPGAPAGARALPPQELARWLVATLDARLRLVQGHSYEWPWPPDRVRTAGALRTARHIVNSSSCWPRRSIAASAGSLPSSDEALVGTYLQSLPDDRSPDVDNGTAPIVE